MLYELPDLESRAANAENIQGKRASGGLAGGGRKGAPCRKDLRPGETYTLLSTEGPGMIRHIWLTFPPSMPGLLRTLILRIYWDGQANPSVEAPVGDFFGVAQARFRPMTNQLTAFQNARGLNAWFPMPFAKHARITIENVSDQLVPMLFYQVDFTLGDRHVSPLGYFHAQFRRATPPVHEDYVILDGVEGRGRYLGTVLGVRKNRSIPYWWGEGEVKMYFDGETTPTICGTGVEDYIGFAWGLGEECAPYQGCPLADNEEGLYSLYRWHIGDPIYFQKSLRVTVQQIGCGSAAQARAALGEDFTSYPAAGHHEHDDVCYFDRSDDYSSVAYWYQTLPTVPFAQLPAVEKLTAGLSADGKTNAVERNDQ
jgi:hypothetical protein